MSKDGAPKKGHMTPRGAEEDRKYRSQNYLNERFDALGKTEKLLGLIGSRIEDAEARKKNMHVAKHYYGMLRAAYVKVVEHVSKLPRPEERPEGMSLIEWNKKTYIYQTTLRVQRLHAAAEAFDRAMKAGGLTGDEKTRIMRLFRYWSERNPDAETAAGTAADKSAEE